MDTEILIRDLSPLLLSDRNSIQGYHENYLDVFFWHWKQGMAQCDCLIELHLNNECD